MAPRTVTTRTRFLALLAAFGLGLGLLAFDAALAQRPNLVGTVVKDSGQPLDGARVELLARGEERVVDRAYTDARGRFAFQTDAGAYDLRVSYGDRVLPQVMGEGTGTRRPVSVGAQPLRLRVEVRI